MKYILFQFLFVAGVCCLSSSITQSEELATANIDSLQNSDDASERATSSSIGPFELSSADSSSWIRFQFAGQLLLYYESVDEGADAGRNNGLFMRARRLRPKVSIRLADPNLLFILHISTTPRSLELMDCYFEYEIAQHIKLRLGQYKVPFTRYRTQSFQRLTFVDWAIVTKGFGAERQMGFALHNGYEKPPEWDYVVGIFTGVNARNSHAVMLPLIYGESVPNASNLHDPAPQTAFHPEIFLRLSHNHGGIAVQSDSDEARKGFRYSAGLSAAWDIDPTAFQDLQVRLAPELLIKHRGLSASAVGYAGFAEIGEPSRTDLAMTGALVQTSFRISDRYEISARYAIVDFTDAVVNDAHQRAQNLIDDAQAVLDTAAERSLPLQHLSDVVSKYENAGQLLCEQETTLGFNIYELGHSLKWQNDIGWLRSTDRNETRDDYIVRSQLQLTF